MSDVVERLCLTADWLDQPPPRSDPPQFSLVSVQREAVDEIEMLWNAVAEKNDEIERLRAFARWAVQEGPFNGCALDGGDVQDKAVELGILTKTKYDPAIHGDNNSDAEPGDDWFVFAGAAA